MTLDNKAIATSDGKPSAACHWIDGKWLEAGKRGNSINPATGEVIGQYFEATPVEAQLAVNAAMHAFKHGNWKHERALRARVLNAMAERFEAHADELVKILGTENGKIYPHGRFETAIVPSTLRFNAALALTDFGRAGSIEAGHLSLTLREPVGVVGIIAPWNSPAALVIRSLAPALAAGTTAAVMLPRQTAQVNALIAKIIAETPELPNGVINIFTGGHEAGGILVNSPHVPVVSFTGSTATGRAISASGAQHLKRFGLELGGKTPMVVFDDADIAAVVPKLVLALTVFSGQFCMTGSRLLVQRGIAGRLRDALAARLEAVKLGPAADATSEMGPLIDKSNVARVNGLVEAAIAAGARAIVRGGPVTEAPLCAGAFYRPTLLEVTDSSLPIVQQEVFGPVLTMQVFDSEEEAIALANDSEYGLAASVWSRDIDRPLRVARALEVGTVWINDWAVLYDQFEEGGFKQSGQGRMRGIAVLDDFVEFKHIALRPGVARV